MSGALSFRSTMGMWSRWPRSVEPLEDDQLESERDQKGGNTLPPGTC